MADSKRLYTDPTWRNDNIGLIWAPFEVGMLTQDRTMTVKCYEFMKGDIRIRVFIIRDIDQIQGCISSS